MTKAIHMAAPVANRDHGHANPPAERLRGSETVKTETMGIAMADHRYLHGRKVVAVVIVMEDTDLLLATNRRRQPPGNNSLLPARATATVVIPDTTLKRPMAFRLRLRQLQVRQVSALSFNSMALHLHRRQTGKHHLRLLTSNLHLPRATLSHPHLLRRDPSDALGSDAMHQVGTGAMGGDIGGNKQAWAYQVQVD